MGWGSIRDSVSDAVQTVTAPVQTAINQGIGVFTDAGDNVARPIFNRPLPRPSGLLESIGGELSNGYSIAGNNIRDTKTQALVTAAPVLNPILDKILGPAPEPDVVSSDYAQDGPYNEPLSFLTNKPLPPGYDGNVLAPGTDTNTPGGTTPGNSTDGYANMIRRFFGGGGNASLGAYGAKTGNGKSFPWVPVLAVVALGSFLFLRKRMK